MNKPIIIIQNKRGRGRGNWEHKGTPGHRGGSADRDMPGEHGKGDANDIELTPEAMDRIKKDLAGGGFSYAPSTDSSPTTGNMVAAYPGRVKKVPKAEFDKDPESYLADFAEVNSDLLYKQPANHMGGWVGDDGLVYLDISRKFSDPTEAFRSARRINEKAYYDIDLATMLSKSGAVDYDASVYLKRTPGKFWHNPNTNKPVYISLIGG